MPCAIIALHYSFFSMSTRFSSLFSGIALSFVVATPVFAATPSTDAVERDIIMSCRAAELPAYRTAIDAALAEMRASISGQWRRQVDFRVRAATAARRAAVRNALAQSTRQLDAALDQFEKSQNGNLEVDTNGALDAYLRLEDEAEDRGLERWADRGASFQALDVVLTRLERTLRTYAVARDRATITRVWNDTRKQAQGAFAQSRVAAREMFVEEMDACVYASPEDETAEPEEYTKEGYPTKTDTKSSTDTSAFRVTSIALDTVSDYVSACSQKVMARAHIYTNGVGRTAGYFLFHDGVRSPEIIADTDAMGHTYAQFQREFSPASGSFTNGNVKYIITSPNAFESNRADFKIECQGSTNPTATTDAKADARLVVDGKSEVNACGMHRYTFTGTITYSAAGDVKYYWLRSDGARSENQTVTFMGAGSKVVSYAWDLGTTYNGWVRLMIIMPNQTQAQADFKLIQNCGTTTDGGTSTTTPPATSDTSAKTTSIRAEAMVTSKSEVTACGGYTFQFKGNISGNVGSKVTYRWQRSDGAMSPENTIILENTTQSVSEAWNLFGSTSGWMKLLISYPESTMSNQASFNFVESCK